MIMNASETRSDEMKNRREIETQTADFRTYKPETLVEKDGSKVVVRLCEELIDGRWEPFLAIVKKGN